MQTSMSRVAALVLLLVAVVLIVLAIVGSGNQMWTALAGVACALGAAATWSAGRRGTTGR